MNKTSFVSIIFFLIIITLIFPRVIFNASPVAIGKYFIAQISSAVGVTAGAQPNPFNTLAQQLKEKELVILDREKDLQKKESELGEKIDKEIATQNKTLLYLLVIGGILLILILFNFYFDYKRRSE